MGAPSQSAANFLARLVDARDASAASTGDANARTCLSRRARRARARARPGTARAAREDSRRVPGYVFRRGDAAPSARARDRRRAARDDVGAMRRARGSRATTARARARASD